ncbi:MAG: tRNA 2-thiocytidine(32) synthetase TtcA [Bacteroides sp.]|nr:tRNA 2-thiocytidine(32) synthetase TtcA [Bacteroides sp.]MCM1549330.1 tRNA 2-thiocytidine(32) synthetase TtcA [Clostridium sp.]
MKPQKLLTYTRKAIDDYHMIQKDDKIAVGISGGKDSLTLLYALSKLRAFYPYPFQLIAITVDLGFSNYDTTLLSQYAESLEVEYYVEKTEIASIVFDYKKESNPCSLCSRLRKGALNARAIELGCNKIAYAHHKDDALDSFIMSLLYEGRLHTFSPVTKLERTNPELIRPLIYAYEGEIASFAAVQQLPVTKNPCPVDGLTKRQEARELIMKLRNTVPEVKERMFSAIIGAGLDGW